MNSWVSLCSTQPTNWGDEFKIKTDDLAALQDIAIKVDNDIKNAIIDVTLPDGTIKKVSNVGVSYGIAETENGAAARLKEHKDARRRSGHRFERDELDQISLRPAESRTGSDIENKIQGRPGLQEVTPFIAEQQKDAALPEDYSGKSGVSVSQNLKSTPEYLKTLTDEVSSLEKELTRPVMPDSAKINDITKGEDNGERIVFRGGKFDKDNITQEGISVTTSRRIAKQFVSGPYSKTNTGRIEKFIIDKSAKIMPFSEIPQMFYKKRAALGLIPLKGRYEDIVEYAKRNGFDGVDLRRFGEKEIRIFNPDVLKPFTEDIPKAWEMTSDDVQKKIDNLLDKYEKEYKEKGKDIYKSYDSLENTAEQLPPDYTPMPEDLAKLYRLRNVLLHKEAKEFISTVVKNSDLPKEEVIHVLSNIGIKEGGLYSDMNSVLQRWGCKAPLFSAR